VFKAGFVLGALEQSFSGAFFWIESVSVCSVSSCDSRQTDDDQIRSLPASLLAKLMFGNVN